MKTPVLDPGTINTLSQTGEKAQSTERYWAAKGNCTFLINNLEVSLNLNVNTCNEKDQTDYTESKGHIKAREIKYSVCVLSLHKAHSICSKCS